MTRRPTQTLFDPMNRRKLLGRSAALMGGAFTGLALQPGNAAAQDKPKTAETGAAPAAKSAPPADPNQTGPTGPIAFALKN